MNEILVVEGLRQWGTCIDSLISKVFTYETREALLLASALGGMAISQTGTSLPHGMGYALTYHKGMPHGLANGVLLRLFMIGHPSYVIYCCIFKCVSKSLDCIKFNDSLYMYKGKS